MTVATWFIRFICYHQIVIKVVAAQSAALKPRNYEAAQSAAS